MLLLKIVGKGDHDVLGEAVGECLRRLFDREPRVVVAIVLAAKELEHLARRAKLLRHRLRKEIGSAVSDRRDQDDAGAALLEHREQLHDDHDVAHCVDGGTELVLVRVVVVEPRHNAAGKVRHPGVHDAGVDARVLGQDAVGEGDRADHRLELEHVRCYQLQRHAAGLGTHASRALFRPRCRTVRQNHGRALLGELQRRVVPGAGTRSGDNDRLAVELPAEQCWWARPTARYQTPHPERYNDPDAGELKRIEVLRYARAQPGGNTKGGRNDEAPHRPGVERLLPRHRWRWHRHVASGDGGLCDPQLS
mmetsp:Transcript_8581/g.22139  ORF Transcript_8581/g.22139 Transcript_8581/m.22139 type:complete len:307 (-) Transcript_8581:14-934(-)